MVKLTFWLGLLTTTSLAQDATIPLAKMCPVGQITVATQVGVVAGTFATVKMSCFVVYPRMTSEVFPIDPNTPSSTTSLTIKIKNTPAPNTQVLIFFNSSLIGNAPINSVTPTGPDVKTFIFTLPTYRPFTVADNILLVYWTLEP